MMDDLDDFELYQALSDTMLDDESDFLSGSSSLFKESIYNSDEAAGVFFNTRDVPFNIAQTSQPSLFSYPLLNGGSQLYAAPPATAAPAASLLFQDSFADIEGNEFGSGRKRPLDEFDELDQLSSNDLFPDTFQKRKIAKRPIFPPSFGMPLPPASSITSNDQFAVSQPVHKVGNSSSIYNTVSAQSPGVDSNDSLPATPFATLSISHSKPEPLPLSISDANKNEMDSINGNASLASSFIRKWTPEEDELLVQAVNESGSFPPKCWKAIAKNVPGRNEQQCLQRWRNVLACHYRKGVWTVEEDEVLRQCYEQFSGVSGSNFHFIKRVPRTWDQLAAEKLNRTAKPCRERWANILDPKLRNDEFTEEEDKRIISLHEQHGNKWKKIASFLDGRTGNRVKSRFYSLTRRSNGEQACE